MRRNFFLFAVLSVLLTSCQDADQDGADIGAESPSDFSMSSHAILNGAPETNDPAVVALFTQETLDYTKITLCDEVSISNCRSERGYYGTCVDISGTQYCVDTCSYSGSAHKECEEDDKHPRFASANKGVFILKSAAQAPCVLRQSALPAHHARRRRLNARRPNNANKLHAPGAALRRFTLHPHDSAS